MWDTNQSDIKRDIANPLLELLEALRSLRSLYIELVIIGNLRVCYLPILTVSWASLYIELLIVGDLRVCYLPY